MKFIANIIARFFIGSLYFILIGAFLGAVLMFVHAIKTKDKGVEVNAVISEVTSRNYVTRHGIRKEYYAYVDYTYEGKEYHEHYDYYNPTDKEGDKITITINCDRPNDILSFKEELTMAIGGLSIYVILAIFLIISQINKRKLKKLGIDVKDIEAVREYTREQRALKQRRKNIKKKLKKSC